MLATALAQAHLGLLSTNEHQVSELGIDLPESLKIKICTSQ